MIVLNISKSNRSFRVKDKEELKIIGPGKSIQVSEACGARLTRKIGGRALYKDLVDAEKYEELAPLAIANAERLNALLKENEELKKKLGLDKPVKKDEKQEVKK